MVCSHSLRGLHATPAMEAGQTLHAVASALGAHTPAVTHAHYIEAGAKRRASTRRMTGKLGDAAASMRVVGNGY